MKIKKTHRSSIKRELRDKETSMDVEMTVEQLIVELWQNFISVFQFKYVSFI